MLVLNKERLVKDTLVTFNYCYEPHRVRTPEEIQQATSTITGNSQYNTVTDILRELIQIMKDNKYNVLNHYNEFTPVNLVKLLFVLGLDIKQYYNEAT